MFVETKREGESQVELQPGQWVLLEAAELLANKGWIQGRLTGKDGSHCVIGAIRAVSDDYKFGSDALGKLKAQLLKLKVYRRFKCSIAFWNDAPERTKAEVIATLRAAARS